MSELHNYSKTVNILIIIVTTADTKSLMLNGRLTENRDAYNSTGPY